jgi:hypothetical protein
MESLFYLWGIFCRGVLHTPISYKGGMLYAPTQINYNNSNQK